MEQSQKSKLTQKIHSSSNLSELIQQKNKIICHFRTLAPELPDGCLRCIHRHNYYYFSACDILKTLVRYRTICSLFISQLSEPEQDSGQIKNTSVKNIQNNQYCIKCIFSYYDSNLNLICSFWCKRIKPRNICAAYSSEERPALKNYMQDLNI